MKGNIYTVYFVFQLQIIRTMASDLQAPCKNPDVLRWLKCWYL